MSSEASRQIIEKRFFDSYNQNLAPENFYIYVEGFAYTPPTGDSYAVLMVEETFSKVTGFTNERERTGILRFNIFVPHGTGTKPVRDIAGYIENIMSRSAGVSNTSNSGTLYIQAVVLKKLSDDNNGYLNYTLDFDYDYYF